VVCSCELSKTLWGRWKLFLFGWRCFSPCETCYAEEIVKLRKELATRRRTRD